MLVKKIKKNHKDYKKLLEYATDYMSKRDTTIKTDGLYYRNMNPMLVWSTDDFIYRYSWGENTIYRIPNVHNKTIPTAMAAMNPVFEVLADETLIDDKKVCDFFMSVIKTDDKKERSKLLVALPELTAFESHSKESTEVKGIYMLRKNLFNYAGLSHGRESNRLLELGLSTLTGTTPTNWHLRHPNFEVTVTDETVTVNQAEIDAKDDFKNDVMANTAS